MGLDAHEHRGSFTTGGIDREGLGGVGTAVVSSTSSRERGALRAMMGYAQAEPTSLTAFSATVLLGFSACRSDLLSHHRFTLSSRGWGEDCSFLADYATSAKEWNGVSCLQTAQAMRASLLASATAALL
jgi:hypothetical protein